MKNFVQNGDTITVTAAAGGVVAGDGLMLYDIDWRHPRNPQTLPPITDSAEPRNSPDEYIRMARSTSDCAEALARLLPQCFQRQEANVSVSFTRPPSLGFIDRIWFLGEDLNL